MREIFSVFGQVSLDTPYRVSYIGDMDTNTDNTNTYRAERDAHDERTKILSGLAIDCTMNRIDAGELLDNDFWDHFDLYVAQFDTEDLKFIVATEILDSYEN